MSIFSIASVKNKFFSVLKECQKNISLYVKSPGKDMTRNRSCPFESTLLTMFSFSANRLDTAILEYFSLSDKKVPSKSAFTQQRHKFNDKLFPHILNEFNKSLPFRKKHKGLPIIAVDGTDLNLPTDKNDHIYAVKQARSDNYYYQMHINALLNVCENRFVDLNIQPRPKMNEGAAFRTMVTSYSEHYKGKALFIADRGYANLSNIAHMQESGHYFLIRSQGPNSPGSFLKHLVENDTEFDKDICFGITRSRKSTYTKHPDKFKCLKRNREFAPIAPEDVNSVYTINLRVVCIRLDSGEYEYLITNLPRNKFKTKEFKELYFMRWGIETSFRTLKYALSLSYLHSVNRELIIQEIYTKVILYNFVSLLHVCASKDLTYNSRKGYEYKVSFENAVPIAKYYMIDLLDHNKIKALILNHLTQIQKASHGTRKVRSQRANPLNNRA